MLAYKGFRKGLICRGYQFKPGINYTDEANCVKNGFHCAANPIDCLSYYPDIHSSEYWIVDARGDIDEDACDSKISCTELHILKKLTTEEFFFHCLVWLSRNSDARVLGRGFARDHSEAFQGYAIVMGKSPVAMGKKEGDILALLQIDIRGKPIATNILKVGFNAIEPGEYYDIHGKEYQYV